MRGGGRRRRSLATARRDPGLAPRCVSEQSTVRLRWENKSPSSQNKQKQNNTPPSPLRSFPLPVPPPAVRMSVGLVSLPDVPWQEGTHVAVTGGPVTGGALTVGRAGRPRDRRRDPPPSRAEQSPEGSHYSKTPRHKAGGRTGGFRHVCGMP